MIERKYSIGDASKLTGISRKQIRYWQSRNYLKDDGRVVSGLRSYRFFSDEDIKTIKAIKILMERGYTLAHASKLAQIK
jgi:MerR family transcriptional regulator, redox-sensitive transcriptional activator SoxR